MRGSFFTHLSWRLPVYVLLAPCLLWQAGPAFGQGGPREGAADLTGRGVRTAQAGPRAPETQNQGNAPRPAGGVRNAPAAPQPPFPPLPEDHQKYLDDILRYWQQSSRDTRRYTCKFERWEYEPVFGPANTYKAYSTGVIKYAAPDKGMFQVLRTLHYTPGKTKEDEPKYVVRKDPETNKEEPGEHWICDGESVFEFNYVKKQLIERQLPPDMRGQAIADGPLPFLFGADAEKIKKRYWVRVITPADAQGEYWLEAFPKSRSDAANFKKVEVIIDEKDFLPKAIQVFYPGYDPKTNPVRAVFQFSERKKNNLVLDPLEIWSKAFYRPATPKGWERIVEKYPTDDTPPPSVNQAKRPSGGAPLK